MEDHHMTILYHLHILHWYMNTINAVYSF